MLRVLAAKHVHGKMSHTNKECSVLLTSPWPSTTTRVAVAVRYRLVVVQLRRARRMNKCSVYCGQTVHGNESTRQHGELADGVP